MLEWVAEARIQPLLTELANTDPETLWTIVMEASIRYHHDCGSGLLDDVVAYLSSSIQDREARADERGRLREHLDEALNEYGFSVVEEAAALDVLWRANGSLTQARAETALAHVWQARADCHGSDHVDAEEVAWTRSRLEQALQRS